MQTPKTDSDPEDLTPQMSATSPGEPAEKSASAAISSESEPMLVGLLPNPDWQGQEMGVRPSSHAGEQRKAARSVVWWALPVLILAGLAVILLLVLREHRVERLGSGARDEVAPNAPLDLKRP